MKELHSLMYHVSLLIILIFIIIMIKEYPSLDKNNLLQAFNKI
jgi:hypothetical protein